MQRPWFQTKNFASLEITKHLSLANHDVEASVYITDTAVMAYFTDRIEQIPAGGEMMKSFSGEAEHITLLFQGEQGIQHLDIINKRFKTPSTGFNTSKVEMETLLYQDIDALLFPDLNKNILKVKDLVLRFPDFAMTYIGYEFQDLAPVTIQIHKDVFSIQHALNIQALEVHSGQLPPQALPFEIKGKQYRLLTYERTEAGRLYPTHFQIETLQ